ncbi:MAG: L-histidine N(alpha)-methyltransferase [Accumulibacter sp.]|jgi:3',5'-cyclic AMP phosphodiesterase CpdA
MSASDEKSPPPAVFTWLHVSDWHFRAKAEENLALRTAINAIPKSVRDFLAEHNKVRSDSPDGINCIIHSGDVSQTGMAAEFEAAQNALTNLAANLAVKPENVVITPGNHDVCNEMAFYPSELQRFRNDAEYLAAQEQWLSRPRMRGILLQRFEYFHQFKRQSGYPAPIEETDGWFVQDIGLPAPGNEKISIAAVNSALVSTRHDQEDRATLLLGRWRIEQVVRELRRPHHRPDRSILVLHHPLAFLNDRDALRCWEVIEDSFDIVLCGHKHGEREIMEHLAYTSGVPMIDAGSIQSSRDPGEVESAEFALGQITLNGAPSGCISVNYFAWDKAARAYVRNHKLDQFGVAKEREPLSFPFANPHRIVPAPAGPTLILHGSTDVAQHKANSSNIVENFYRQREDKSHQEGNSPKRELILPTKQFFWHVESRGLFECMTAQPEYWLGTESKGFFDEHLDDMVKTTGQTTLFHDELLVAVLGVGNGSKETTFFDRLKAWRGDRGKQTTLLFIDINYQMILRASRRVGNGSGLRFCNADFDYLNPKHLAGDYGVATASPTLFLLFGNTFANQFEAALLSQLRSLGSDIWLIFDAPLLNRRATQQTEGYGTDAAKEFKELTLRHFDKRYERKWRTRQPQRIVPRIVTSKISDVPEAETLSNVANSPTFGHIWIGMSHRYKKDKLEEFLVAQQWAIVPWTFTPKVTECRYYLIQPSGKSTVPAAPA